VRILCDGDGKLNEKSVLIDFPELSMKIYLDLSEVFFLLEFFEKFFDFICIYR